MSSKDGLGTGEWRYSYKHKLLLRQAQHDSSHKSTGKKNYIRYPKYHDHVKKKIGLGTSGRGEMGAQGEDQIRLHPNSCNMEEIIITVAISKWVLFRTAGEERISCSLASRQGALSTLIRSVCSARTHVCGLWTLENRCLSHTELPTLQVHLIHQWWRRSYMQIYAMDISLDINAITQPGVWLLASFDHYAWK